MSVILFKDGKSQKFDEYTFIDSLNAGWSLTEDAVEAPVKVEIIQPEEKIEDVKEEVVIDFDEMSKKEFEAYARTIEGKDGNPIELDRRMNKANMIKDFNEKKG